MGVRLTWTDNNVGETNHKIYRSTSTMDPMSLPTALDTIAAELEEYEDGSVAVDTTYYYRVASTVGGVEFVSDEVSIYTGAGAFTPDDLFASSEVGAWFNFTDVTTLWTDVAGTTQVASDGDLVARADDQSGNGLHLLQPTSGNRPIYRTGGGKSWIEFNGTTHYLQRGSSSDMFRNIGSGLIGLAIRDVGTLGSDDRLAYVDSATTAFTRAVVRTHTSGTAPSIGGRRLDGDSFDSHEFTGESFGTGAISVIANFDYANSDVELYLDGTAVTEDTAFQTDGNTSDTVCANFSIGAAAAGANFTQMDLYYAVFVGDSSHSGTEISDLDTYFQAAIT